MEACPVSPDSWAGQLWDPTAIRATNELLVRRSGRINKLCLSDQGLSVYLVYLRDLCASKVRGNREVARCVLLRDKGLSVLFPRRRPSTEALHRYCVLTEGDGEMGVFAGADGEDVFAVERNVVAVSHADEAAIASEHERRRSGACCDRGQNRQCGRRSRNRQGLRPLECMSSFSWLLSGSWMRVRNAYTWFLRHL